MKRSLRVPLAAALLLAGIGGLAAAWYLSSREALEAGIRLRSQQAERSAGERERALAESLARRLEELRAAESLRPYFHYQNLYHDPRGASEGLSVVPSPLAAGPVHPLVLAHFQIDANGSVSLPTLNDELRDLDAPNVARQRAIRDELAASSTAIRTAASKAVARIEREDSEAEKTASRIAQLEAQLASSPKVQLLDPSAFAQNAQANTVYRQLKENRRPASVASGPAPPVEIRMSDLEWHSIVTRGGERLLALRAVHTPAGMLVQGMLTPIRDGGSIDAAIARQGRGRGSPIAGTDWRLELPLDAPVEDEGERARFTALFTAVCVVLFLVVAGVIWNLHRAETLAIERTRFAATAAHELRTPLASLRLHSDLIADEGDAGKRDRYAREIASQTDRLGRVVANVLETTRLERGTFTLRPRPGPIGPAVEEYVARLRPQLAAADCPLDFEMDPELPPVSFDPDALHHVVDNLVDNAEKFSRDVAQRRISVAVTREDGGVAITVSDRGPGLPEGFLLHARPFRRGPAASPAGLGLGLFLVARVVRDHGGSVSSVRRAGGGSSIRVLLPAFYKV